MDEHINKAYIHSISTHGLRNIEDIKLDLDSEKPLHLILTGDNGVGKTTFIQELYKSLSFQVNSDYTKPNEAFPHLVKDYSDKNLAQILNHPETFQRSFMQRAIDEYPIKCKVLPDNLFNWEYAALYSSGEFKTLIFNAHRKQHFKTPDGPRKLNKTTDGSEFIQNMVNILTWAALAKMKGDTEREKSMNDWFSKFEDSLSILLGHNDFGLKFLDEDFNFIIKEKSKEPYHFTELSDGYSAILMMVGEIMLQMATGASEAYDMPGIVIIDELETHLHVSLQKRILPFLTKMFPRIQFIVTTHSPFIISSISDAVVYDLGSKKLYRDLNGFSYSNLIEGYFDINQYSDNIQKQLSKMEEILSKETLSDDEKNQIADFDGMISSLSILEPLQLQNRWLDLKLENRSKL